MTDSIPAFLVVGDDPYLVGEAVDGIAGEAPADMAAFSPPHDVGEILQAARTPSMFGGQRLLVVREADLISADDQRRIASYLEDPTPNVTLILISAKKLPRVAEAIKKVGKIIEASKGRRSDLFGWIKKESSARGLKISGDAMAALVEAVGEERMALANSLDELRLALGEGGRAGQEEIRGQFTSKAETRLFAFVDAVATRRTDAALELLRRLFQQQESPQRMFWTLTSHFKMLLLTGGSVDEVAGALGLPRWRAEKLVRQARGFSREALVSAYQVLAESDRKMKASEEPEELTLERAVVAITGG